MSIEALEQSLVQSPFTGADDQVVVRSSFRVSVLVPTVSNPPDRVRFAPALFTALESLLFNLGGGWTLRPGLYVGEWSSSTLGRVRDESRVYDVIVPTFDRACVVTARFSAFVKERFNQEQVLVTIAHEFSTLIPPVTEHTCSETLGGTDDFTSLG